VTGGPDADRTEPGADPAEIFGLAEQVLARARGLGLTLAVAESLTGGQLAAALTCVPGASAVFRGSVTAYATDLKAAILGVDGALLAEVGPVHAEVARQMAWGVRRVCSADLGIATTGVAGPDAQDGRPVGTVFVAFCGLGRVDADPCAFGTGGLEGTAVRARVQRLSTAAALNLTLRHLAQHAGG
jgi:nicotinamide-nucleotide amidase